MDDKRNKEKIEKIKKKALDVFVNSIPFILGLGGFILIPMLIILAMVVYIIILAAAAFIIIKSLIVKKDDTQ